MRKISKNNIKSFVKETKSILKDNQAETVEDIIFDSYKLQTKAGNLIVNLPKSKDEDTYIYTIFTHFENVAKAKEYCSCNPYSGKYNFFDSKKDDILDEFKSFLCYMAM